MWLWWIYLCWDLYQINLCMICLHKLQICEFFYCGWFVVFCFFCVCMYDVMIMKAQLVNLIDDFVCICWINPPNNILNTVFFLLEWETVVGHWPGNQVQCLSGDCFCCLEQETLIATSHPVVILYIYQGTAEEPTWLMLSSLTKMTCNWSREISIFQTRRASIVVSWFYVYYVVILVVANS